MDTHHDISVFIEKFKNFLQEPKAAPKTPRMQKNIGQLQ